MKSKTRILLAALLFGNLLVPGAVFAQGTIDWGGYHKDERHTGFVDSLKEDGSQIGLIYTFPRTDASPINAKNNVVDIPGSPNTDWIVPGGWNDHTAITDLLGAPNDFYGPSKGTVGAGYYWSPVARDDYPNASPNVSIAEWKLPSTFNNQHHPSLTANDYFQIQVWFPSSGGGKTNYNAVIFFVTDVDGKPWGPFYVDQRSGGTWVTITDQVFHMGPGAKVRISNGIRAQTYDNMKKADDDFGTSILANTIVCADAIRLVPSSGIEIYASPAAGQVKMDVLTSMGVVNKLTPVAWVGDVEKPLAWHGDSTKLANLEGNPEFGAMYCIRSDNQTSTTLDYKTVTDSATWNNNPEALAVGSAFWRYPMGGRYDPRKPIGRDRVEGPIGRIGEVGGVFSSPLIHDIGASNATATPHTIFGGMDGQVYCIDATNGRLKWKGPGVTIPEPEPAALHPADPPYLGEPTPPSSWSVEDGGGDGRYDAFGGTFSYALATNSYSSGESMVYAIDTGSGGRMNDAQYDAHNGNGHMYAIYAWIPAKMVSDPLRVRDAYYGITYNGKTDPEWVHVDLGTPGDPTAYPTAVAGEEYSPLPSDPNVGRWVRVGGSYWNPTKVELSTQSRMDSKYLTGRVVVADAIMVVPDGIGPFSYSSPVDDGRITSKDGKIFIGNTNGRLYALHTDVQETTYDSAKATKMAWAFPKLQTANPVRNDIDAEAAPWGSIISSPARTDTDADSKVIVSTSDGYVHAIEKIDTGELGVDHYWSYDSAEGVPTTPNNSDPEQEPFSSSPTVYIYGTDRKVYVPSASGRMHALYLDKQTGSQRAWVYPDRTKGAVPLPAFRFSTPAIVRLPGDFNDHRIYCGSSGGKLFGFWDLGTSGRLMIDEPTGFEFKNPNFQGPIQGSAAVDGVNLSATEDYADYNGNIFVSTMGTGDTGEDGGIFWVNRRTGFASSGGTYLWNYAGYTGLGNVFSSPAIANNYTYVGIGKGRLIALSAMAFGGAWIGGGFDQKDDVPFAKTMPQDEISPVSPHVDLFLESVHSDTKGVFDTAATYASGSKLASGPNLLELKDLPDNDLPHKPHFMFGTGFEPNEPWDGHKRAFDWDQNDLNGTRQVFYEWGEDVYAIAWNLPPLSTGQQVYDEVGKVWKAAPPIAGGGYSGNGVGSGNQRGGVSFRFIDSSPGYGSGGTLNPKHPDFLYEYSFIAKDSSGAVLNDPVAGTPYIYKRTVAMVKVELKADSSNPPAPGTGWHVSVSAAVDDPTSGQRAAVMPISVPRLKGSPGSWAIDTTATFGLRTTALSQTKIPEQDVGVNCPLAIIGSTLTPGILPTDPPREAATATDLAWPKSGNNGTLGKYYIPNRSDPEAHFNGNGYAVSKSNTTAVDSDNANNDWVETTPFVYLGWAQHGSNTTPGILGVMDRSAVGLRVVSALDTNADNTADKFFRTDAIKTLRFESHDLHWRGGNGAAQNVLPWDFKPYFEDAGLKWTGRQQRDYPDISRNELLFQKSPDNNDPAQDKATLQPTVAKNPNAAVVIYGKDDCYLRADSVESWVEVPQFQPANMTGPGYDSRIIAYLDTNGNGRFDGGEITADRPSTRVEPYRKFKMSLDVMPDYHMVIERPLTIEITGQDRAPAPHGLGIGVEPTKMAKNQWYKSFTLRNLGNVNLYNLKVGTPDLFADNVNWCFRMPGFMNTKPLGTVNTGIVSSLDGWDPTWGDINVEPFATDNYGFTLSKALVGDVDGTVLTIPDARKVKNWANTTKPAIIQKNIDSQVAAEVPPADINYNDESAIEPSISVRVPLSQPTGTYHQIVPIFANMGANTPRTDPSFLVNVAVAEDRLTGEPTPGSAVQIDSGSGATNGDVQPAAWRDPATGDVHVFWSSNRFQGMAVQGSPAPVKAGDPWYLHHATLPYNLADQNDTNGVYKGAKGAYNWKYGIEPVAATDLPSWWKAPLPGDNDYPFPKFAFPTGANWPAPAPTGAIESSVKYSAPFAATVEGTPDTWLFWQGQVDVQDAVTNKIQRQSTIFYTDATNGSVASVATGTSGLYSLARDPFAAKQNPKAVVYRTGKGANSAENMLLVWNGGDAGRWSLYAAYNSSGTTHEPKNWSQDMKLKIPSCLVSASEPMVIHRPLHMTTADDYFDVVYTGAWKYDQSTDIILSRYQLKNPDTKPSMKVIPLPRVLGEEMLRDTKRNVYTSEHLAWLRPPTAGAVDQWANPNTWEPFIRVVLPNGQAVSATDGSYRATNNGTWTAGVALKPSQDRATDIYTYSYTTATSTDASAILGQTLVDFSAGIVRFTNPLPPNTKVYVDYTPQAMRLTRGVEQDSAPFVFIEKTKMSALGNPKPNPGLIGNKDSSGNETFPPVDRLWVFWRKPSTSGVQSSTIYYKTYRMAADLKDATGTLRSMKLNTDGTPVYTDVAVTGGAGSMPMEVSWDGKKLYFPADVERYPGMPGYPGNFVLNYDDYQSTTVTIAINTLTWQEELPETALPTRQRVNEGQVSAFADPSVRPTKVWVFWSSTRAGKSDLYYQTISPNFRALY